MKLLDSHLSRRTLLGRMLFGWVVALGAILGYPAARYLEPSPAPDPDFVILNAQEYLGIPANSTKPFAYGYKLGIFLKASDGNYRVFKGVCTHLDCNVSYKEEQRKFFCACHEGWFDEFGKNVAGPPPAPLMALNHEVVGEKLLILKPGGKYPPPELLG